jgi:hypothetical protein
VKREQGRFDVLVDNAAKPVATKMPGGFGKAA